MPNVDISINGRLYGVACDEGQEGRVRDLAGEVDARVRRLVGGSGPGAVGETHILVLAGLMLADELDEAKAALLVKEAQCEPAEREPGQPNGGLEDAELIVAAVDHLAQRIAGIADRLDRT